MSAVAETVEIEHPHVKANDALARRNAIVLAVAQALAGGNNTVIVATASIAGAMLAPDKGLATLPITAMIFGMWFGTLPLGFLARHYGRRFALQTGSAFGIVSGLIFFSAGTPGRFAPLLLRPVFGGGLSAPPKFYPLSPPRPPSESLRPQGGA